MSLPWSCGIVVGKQILLIYTRQRLSSSLSGPAMCCLLVWGDRAAAHRASLPAALLAAEHAQQALLLSGGRQACRVGRQAGGPWSRGGRGRRPCSMVVSSHVASGSGRGGDSTGRAPSPPLPPSQTLTQLLARILHLQHVAIIGAAPPQAGAAPPRVGLRCRRLVRLQLQLWGRGAAECATARLHYQRDAPQHGLDWLGSHAARGMVAGGRMLVGGKPQGRRPPEAAGVPACPPPPPLTFAARHPLLLSAPGVSEGGRACEAYFYSKAICSMDAAPCCCRECRARRPIGC